MSSSLLQPESVVNNRFRLIRKIGQGGMGSVWETHDQNLGNICAIKFIEGQLANVVEAQDRFKREATAAAALRSQHVVQILDHGVWLDIPYIAMELLRGQDLGKRIASRPSGKLEPAEVTTIVNQVCRALTKAHAGHVVHRDLKPDNIFLVVEDDDSELVKILDFGVAKQTGQAIEGTNTKTGAMLGTPYYMSPEQAQGIKSVDYRSDLWSLAVIVFQCLTGRLPYESEALGDLLVKIIRDDPPVPTHYNPQLPQGFNVWWGKASQRNPDARFQSAKEFAAELQMSLGLTIGPNTTTDRSQMQRMAPGGTALMNDAGANVAEMRRMLAGGANANTPFPAPNQYNAAMMQTPNPSNPGVLGAPPYMQTPQGAQQGGTQALPMMQTPSNPQMMMNPAAGATFSGVEPPAGVPKKGPPVILLAAVLGVGVLVMAGGGYAYLSSRRAAGQQIPTASTASASAPLAASNVPPPASAASTNAPATSASSATATNDAPPPTGPGAGTPDKPTPDKPGTTPAPHGTKLATAPTGKTPAKPSATPPPTTATPPSTGASSGGVTPHGVGF